MYKVFMRNKHRVLLFAVILVLLAFSGGAYADIRLILEYPQMAMYNKSGSSSMNADDMQTTPASSLNNPSWEVNDLAMELYGVNVYNNATNSGIRIYRYGETANNSIGRAYMDLMGSVSFVDEIRGLGAGPVNYERRTFTHYLTAKTLLETACNDHERTKNLIAQGRQSMIDKGRVFGEPDDLIALAFNSSSAATATRPGKNIIPYTGYRITHNMKGEEVSRSVVSNETRYNNITRSSPRPTAYIRLEQDDPRAVLANIHEPTSITLNKTAVSLLIGGSEMLIATVLPATSNNKDVTWSSDNELVATAGSTGLVRAVGAGSANIIAKTVDGGFTAACNILVTTPVSGITITPPVLSLDAGDTYWLTATVYPFNVSNANINWSSSNTAVATVNGAGFVTGVAPGTVTITAEAADGSEVTATVEVFVPYVPLAGVTLDRTYYVFSSIGATLQLTPTVIPGAATDQTVTWLSATPGVATVSATGLVTAVSAGSAAVLVTTNDGGFTASCNIFVQIGGAGDPSNDIVPEQPALPPGTPGGIVSAEPIIIIPADSTDISLEADMLATILPGFSSEDFHVNEYGIVTLEDWIAQEIAKRRLNIYDVEVVMLPAFEAMVNNPGEIAAVSFEVKGSHLMVEGLISRPENVRLLMALSSTSGDFFTYTDVPADFGDKMFTILDAGNNIFTGEIDPNGDYKVLFFIKDGGGFDLDRQTDATVWGVMAFVGVPVLGVTLSPDHVPLQVGQTYDFSPGVGFLPPIADNKRVTWTSDSSLVATVSPAGVVTAIGPGPANITVRTVDGGFWDISTVLVSTPVSSVTVTPATASIGVGGMVILDAYVLPFNATISTVVWSSDNEAIATVTQGGAVRGVAAGPVTIRATAIDGSGVFGSCAVTVTP